MSKRNYTRVLDKATAVRSHRLGRIGEEWAETLLVRNGFTHVHNLNVKQANHSYADIYAEKDGQKYVISVKTRNKLQAGGTLNGLYNLSSLGNHYETAAMAESSLGAKAAWIAIAVEEGVFSAYFGLLIDLNGKNGIPMTETAVSKYQCLAKSEPHQLDYSQIKNVYDDVIPATQEVDVFAIAYPVVTAWIRNGGWIELGTDHNVRSFIRALDEGGIVWEGVHEYPTVDAAFKALNAGIALFIKEQGINL